VLSSRLSETLVLAALAACPGRMADHRPLHRQPRRRQQLRRQAPVGALASQRGTQVPCKQAARRLLTTVISGPLNGAYEIELHHSNSPHVRLGGHKVRHLVPALRVYGPIVVPAECAFLRIRRKHQKLFARFIII
jgi:hypothetical protein